jgi:predicted DNA-binding transcriptional regulator AlpA
MGQLLGELEQALERAGFEDTPILLGELERLRARLWSRMMTPASTPRTTNVAAEKEKWLTANQAAEILQVDRKWLYRRASNLPFCRRLSRRKLLFSESGLRRWMSHRKP